MSETPTTDIVKWYTRARKFPQLIGRTPDGMKLWGGPYTITQAVGFGVVLFVGLNTRSLWAHFGFIGNALLLGTVAVGVVIGLGRIPVGSRSPLSVASGAWRAVASPQHGRLGGRPVRIRRPHRLRHTVVVQLNPGTQPAPAPVPADPTPAREVAPPRPRRAWRPRRTRPNRPTSAAPVTPPTPPAAPALPEQPVPALTGIQALLASSTAVPHRSETTR